MSDRVEADRATYLARLPADASTAAMLVGLLAELLDPAETAVAAVVTGDRWFIEIHFTRAPSEAALRRVVASTAGPAAAGLIEFETLAGRNWVAAGMTDLTPVAAGRFVVHGRHDRAGVTINCVAIVIEAGLAFGTGHHGTTQGCLTALDRMFKAWRPVRILDVGTGSGVLAIAAAKFLRRRVRAGDIDRRAVTVARDNARANGVGALVEVVQAGGGNSSRLRRGAPFDLIVANILLGPLRRLALPLSRLSGRKTRVVLSGLLSRQAAAALASYRALGFSLERRIPIDGWVTLVLARRPHPRPIEASAWRRNRPVAAIRTRP